jgi:hypothetical protein
MLTTGSDVDGERPVTRKSRRARFVEVAGKRTNRVLRELQLLGNCGNKSAYEYTDADVARMFAAIEQELETARARFRKPEKEQVKFTFE